MNTVCCVFSLIAIAIFAYWAFVKNQGDAELELKVDERTPFEVVNIDEKSVTLRTKVAMVNKGKQIGTIMDCYARHLLPYEQFDGVKVESRICREHAVREDDYFEAYLLKRTTRVNLYLEVTLIARKEEDIKTVLTHMVDMPIDIVYQAVTRIDWYINKSRIVLTNTELAQAIGITLADD